MKDMGMCRVFVVKGEHALKLEVLLNVTLARISLPLNPW